MQILVNRPSQARQFLPSRDEPPLREVGQDGCSEPQDSWSPLLLGSSLGAMIGAGLVAGDLGSGVTAGLLGFGAAYTSAQALGVSRYEDVGLLLFGTGVAATTAAAWAAGPTGIAFLGAAALGALALERTFISEKALPRNSVSPSKNDPSPNRFS